MIDNSNTSQKYRKPIRAYRTFPLDVDVMNEINQIAINEKTGFNDVINAILRDVLELDNRITDEPVESEGDNNE